MAVLTIIFLGGSRKDFSIDWLTWTPLQNNEGV